MPFIFAIDGNEPKEETLETVTFHWEEGRSGVKKFASLLGREPIHRARDILRQTMERIWAARASETVAVTYDTGGETGQRRLDSIWATEEFEIEDFQAHYRPHSRPAVITPCWRRKFARHVVSVR